ncbi:uncharacterized protein PG986_010324 [Apiospora aurea]|uniref:Uncharacterized protein n=1 Tax=Apiospora aurea TaxID=335848 RepID=A0ABR1Q1W7_9PEZI
MTTFSEYVDEVERQRTPEEAGPIPVGSQSLSRPDDYVYTAGRTGAQDSPSRPVAEGLDMREPYKGWSLLTLARQAGHHDVAFA